MRARVSILLLSCAVAVVGAQAPPANGSSQQPTFRGGINYVRVDMYASTQDGRPILDLRRDEIELLEDGKPQVIKDFDHVQVAAGTPQELRSEPNTVAESREMAASGRARVFVIFLDTYHTTIEGSANMRTPLVRFLDRLVGPDDLVAVMTPEMAASDITFGRKTTVISNIMQREWTWGRRDRINPIDDKEQLYQACFPPDSAREMALRRREKLTLDALDDLVVFLQGVRDERKAIVTVSDGWILYTPNRTLASRGLDAVPDIGGVFGGNGRTTSGRNRASGTDLTECEADRNVLAEMNNSFRVREITDAANRTNVTFYPVYPRGLVVFDSAIGPDPPPTQQQDAANLRGRQESLRALAQDTDGTAVINTNDIERGLSRIVADLSSYYLLGYESTNNKLDGKYRTIAVKVTRPEVQVRARRGYRGLTAEEVVSVNESRTSSAGAASAPPPVSVNPRAPFRLRSSAWTSDTAGSLAASVWLVGELDFATRKDLAWSNGANAEISVLSASGERVASLQVPFATAEGGFTLKLPTDTPLTPGDYAVRVRVVPQNGQALPLSDLVRVVVPAAAMPLGESVMLRRGPSTGPRYIATADPRFSRNDRLRLEIPTRLDDAPVARLLDRTGKPLQVPVTTSDRRDDAGFRWVVVDAALAPLAPGEYGLEVTLGSAKQVTPLRIVP